jgi:hypothetical protein
VKMVFSSHDSVLVGYLQGLLENEGIDTVIKNGPLAGAAGELPPTECWPELWVTDDPYYEQACRIVETALGYECSNFQAWTCPKCGETSEGHFVKCWNCGESFPEET